MKNRVPSEINAHLKSGKNAFLIMTLAAIQLLSACSNDPQVKKYETRIKAATDLENMNKEGNEYQAAKDTLDLKGKISDQDPTNIDKAKAAKEAAEKAADEKKDFEDAKEKYASSKDKADEAAEKAK